MSSERLRDGVRAGLLLAVLLAMAIPSAGVASATEPGRDGGLPQGLKAAAATGRPVFVRVHAEWCEQCDLMERTTYRDSGVVAEIERMVTVRVNAESDALFARRYDLQVLPVALVLDDRGREITRMAGYIGAQPLAEKLRAVSSGYAGYRADLRLGRDAGALERIADYFVSAGNAEDAIRYYKRALKRLGDGDLARRDQLRAALTTLRSDRNAVLAK